jgi:hypothetical protein
MENKSKHQSQIEQQILYNFLQIVELFPQYTIAQHWIHILRKKNEAKEAYYWSNDITLKKIEQYYDELKQDLTDTPEEID